MPLHMERGCIDLTVEQYAINAFLDEEISVPSHQVSLTTQYCLKNMARQLMLSLRLPGMKLPRVQVAEYPATWWDHLKQRLGFRHETTKVYREDTVVFPDIA